MDVGVAGRPPAEHDGLEVEGLASGVGDGHVHHPLQLLLLGTLAVGAQDPHHHVQSTGAGQRHVLQQW